MQFLCKISNMTRLNRTFIVNMVNHARLTILQIPKLASRSLELKGVFKFLFQMFIDWEEALFPALLSSLQCLVYLPVVALQA